MFEGNICFPVSLLIVCLFLFSFGPVEVQMTQIGASSADPESTWNTSAPQHPDGHQLDLNPPKHAEQTAAK